MKIIKRERQHLIIEHDGLRYKTREEVFNSYRLGRYTIDDLIMRAIPISIPWAEFIDLSHLTAETIEHELHRHGIHTIQDLVGGYQIANSAITKAVNVAPGMLAKKAKQKAER